MNNQLVAKIFRDVAEILQIKGDNLFRIRAYERAAQNIESLSEDVSVFVAENRLLQIPGIGKDLADKITEIVQTGRLRFMEELKKTIPEGVLDLLKIPSIGPKTAKVLYDTLGIASIGDLEEAIRRNRLVGIEGIKEKTVLNIQKGIALLKRGKERMLLSLATQTAGTFTGPLEQLEDVQALSVAGSLRRQKETVRDIDILIVSSKPAKVMDVFVHLPEVKEVLAHGETKSSVRTKDDVQVDCRVVEKKAFGAALLYFTGSKNFNIKIRKLAIAKGLKINEYGVFKKDSWLCGTTEEEIFKKLNMQFIEPELREDTGEIELAKKFSLPALITQKDIRGDFHVHSRWSDGNNTIAAMAEAAREKGYSYVAITDHSQGLKVAGGLSIPQVHAKRKEIDLLNKKLKGFKILFGSEVDIDSDGRLDYPDAVLAGFDIVIAAIHTGFKQPKEQLTRRLIRACENKYVHIIAHPTGRLWGERDSYELDFDAVLKAAQETNTALEINSFPDRLDLNDLYCRKAKENNVRIAINTDSHSTDHLGHMRFGIAVARRGWLSSSDVLNTLPLAQLLKTIKK